MKTFVYLGINHKVGGGRIRNAEHQAAPTGESTHLRTHSCDFTETSLSAGLFTINDSLIDKAEDIDKQEGRKKETEKG